MKREVFEFLLSALEASAKKHGKTTPVTLGHLHNICKVAVVNYYKQLEIDAEADARDLSEASNINQ